MSPQGGSYFTIADKIADTKLKIRMKTGKLISAQVRLY